MGRESEKCGAMETSISDINTYSKLENRKLWLVLWYVYTIFAGDPVSIKISKDSPGYFMLRSRVPSYHMRELTRGQFMVKSKDITLLNCIGEGQNGLPEASMYT